MLNCRCRAVFTVIFFLLFAVNLAGVENVSAPPSYRDMESLEKIQEMDQVLFLLQKRLATMHEIARSKWIQKVEVEDLLQEKQTMAKFVKFAVAYGVNKEWATTFFQAQTEAGKAIQLRDFDYWTKEDAGDFDMVADLSTDIRPYLDRLTKELLKALADLSLNLKEGELELIILDQPLLTRPSDRIDEDIWLQAIAPLYDYGS